MVRWTNTTLAVALAAFVLGNDWPIVKVFDLARADRPYQGIWIEGHAKRIMAVTTGRVADRAGLKIGDTGAGDWSARPPVRFERRIVLLPAVCRLPSAFSHEGHRWSPEY
jgi:hypothetical protein